MMMEIIQKLSVGQVIKNYIEWCKILGVKPTRGKGRDYHIRELERYCKYHKEKQKFVIDEVFDEPLPKIDNRKGGNNTKYEDLMDKLIINLLIDYERIEESYSSLMNNYFDFFTDEYNKLNKVGYKRYSKINSMGKGVIMTYQIKMNEVVKTCLVTSLNRLKRNNIIEYEENIMVLDSNFSKSYADDDMKKLIKKYEDKVYDELDTTPFKRSNPRINRQFKNKVCEYLDVMNYWNVYCFEIIDKNTEQVEEDSDELVRRFIKSTEQNTKNTNYTDDDGEKYKPYSYDKYEGSIDKLTKLFWKLPEGYTSEQDFKQLLIGNVTDISNRYKEYEQEQTGTDENYGIPF